MKFDYQDSDKSNGVEIEYDSYNLVIANKNVEFDYSFDEDVSIPMGVPCFSGDTDAQKFDSLFDISFLNGKVTICIHGTHTKLGFVKESNLVEDCYFSTVGDNISYDLELFKYLDRPNWTGEHYRRVFDINDIFEENVSHALVAENVLEDDEGHYLDGVFSKSKSALSIYIVGNPIYGIL